MKLDPLWPIKALIASMPPATIRALSRAIPAIQIPVILISGVIGGNIIYSEMLSVPQKCLYLAPLAIILLLDCIFCILILLQNWRDLEREEKALQQETGAEEPYPERGGFETDPKYN